MFLHGLAESSQLFRVDIRCLKISSMRADVSLQINQSDEITSNNEGHLKADNEDLAQNKLKVE